MCIILLLLLLLLLLLFSFIVSFLADTRVRKKIKLVCVYLCVSQTLVALLKSEEDL